MIDIAQEVVARDQPKVSSNGLKNTPKEFTIPKTIEPMIMPKEKHGPYAYKVPVFAHPERCNTCELCYRMCPHWAINVDLCVKAEGEAVTREKVSRPPRLASVPPIANCSWCQHPVVGRIVAEVLDEMGVNGKVVPIDAMICNASSAFGIPLGRFLTRYERPCDIAALTKKSQPDALVFLVQDQDIATMDDTFLGALILGEKFTMIMCIYILINDLPFAYSKEIDESRFVDYAKDGTVIGIELLYVSGGVDTYGLPFADELERLLGEHGIKVYA